MSKFVDSLEKNDLAAIFRPRPWLSAFIWVLRGLVVATALVCFNSAVIQAYLSTPFQRSIYLGGIGAAILAYRALDEWRSRFS